MVCFPCVAVISLVVHTLSCIHGSLVGTDTRASHTAGGAVSAGGGVSPSGDGVSVSSERSSMSFSTRASDAAADREKQLMEILAAQAGTVPLFKQSMSRGCTPCSLAFVL